MRNPFAYITLHDVQDFSLSLMSGLLLSCKKALFAFTLILMLLSCAKGAMAHDSRVGVEFYFNGIRYAFQPYIDSKIRQIRWVSEKIVVPYTTLMIKDIEQQTMKAIQQTK